MTARAIQTRYGGLRLRSRTEARWCVFFDAIGIRFRYEAEGYLIRSGSYLPDFWLPDLNLFFEVKGADPTEEERRKCSELTQATECSLILAAGPPEERFQLLWFDRDGESDDRFVLARDRAIAFGFWLVREEGDGIRIGPTLTTEGRPAGPMFSGALEQAYAAAQSARFEFGEGRARHPVIQERDPDRIEARRYIETERAA